MIEIRQSDIFEDLDERSILVHQTNFYGVMGAGIAVVIKKKFPDVFKQYYELCNSTEDKKSLLGTCQMCKVSDNLYVFNAFGQNDMSWDACVTDYKAWHKICKHILETVAHANRLVYGTKWTVHIPYKIGCGIAGGDVDTMHKIFKKYFEDAPFKVVFHDIGKVINYD